MKKYYILLLLIIAVVSCINCSQGKCKGKQAPSLGQVDKRSFDTTSQNSKNDSSVTFKIFEKLVDRDIDGGDSIPEKYVNQFIPCVPTEGAFLGFWISRFDNYKIGLHKRYYNSYVDDIVIVYSDSGETLDCFSFRESRKIDNRWAKFYNRFNYSAKNGSYSISHLDTTQDVSHPDLAKVISKTEFRISKEGKFEFYNY